MGGVGSLAAAHLLPWLVLRHDPDVCFIECSALDAAGATPSHHVRPVISGMVRRLIRAGVLPILLHLPWADVSAEQIGRTLQDYGKVAIDFGVPEVSLWDQFGGALAHSEGAEIWFDDAHTTTSGAQQYAAEIMDQLARLRSPVGGICPCAYRRRGAGLCLRRCASS